MLSIDGVSLRQLSPEDTLLYLSVHLAVHHGYGVARMFVDLDRLIRLGPALDWGILTRRAQGTGLRNVVYFALDLTRLLLGTPIPDGVLQNLKPPVPIRWAVTRLIDPVRIARGEPPFGPQSERFLHFLLVDRWRDRLGGLVRVFLPGKDWIAARYSVKQPYLVAVYSALHPLRVTWLAAVALGQLLGRA